MCDFLDKRLETAKKYKDIIVMFGGFAFAVCIYQDFKAFTAHAQDIQIQQTEVLRGIEIRLSELEGK
ncbi:MAG: hypothetical protein RSE01_08990 [Akkermansia sp.]